MTSVNVMRHVAGDRGHQSLFADIVFVIQICNEMKGMLVRQDKTFIIIILQVQFFGSQLAIKR